MDNKAYKPGSQSMFAKRKKNWLAYNLAKSEN